MTAKAGVLSDIYIAGLPSVGVVDEATTDVGVAGGVLVRQWYQVTNAARRRVDKAVVPVVERDVSGGGWSTVPASQYVFNYVLGRVEFIAQQASGTSIRIDFNYLPLTKLGGGKEWSADLGADVSDVSEFGDTWRRKISTVKDGSCSLGRWWLDAAMLTLLTAGNPLVVVLYADYAANLRYEAYARLSTGSIDTAVDGVVEEDLDFEFDGPAYYATT